MALADEFLSLTPKFQSKLFYIWGHSYEFDVDSNWELIEAFTEKMANKEDIWHCTNMELYQACLDHARLEGSADEMHIYNPAPVLCGSWIRRKMSTKSSPVPL